MTKYTNLFGDKLDNIFNKNPFMPSSMNLDASLSHARLLHCIGKLPQNLQMPLYISVCSYLIHLTPKSLFPRPKT